MELNTHPNISAELVGTVTSIDNGTARAELLATEPMASDARGLVHGGFTFGLADYAAMCAVNDPNVVLGAADCKFVAPVRVGETMVARAVIDATKGKKRVVGVVVDVAGKTVFEAAFTCFVLERHVLDG